MPIRKVVVSLIASGAVLVTGIATNPVTAATLPASAAMLQDAALARGRVILVGLRYLYGSRYYPPYSQRYIQKIWSVLFRLSRIPSVLCAIKYLRHDAVLSAEILHRAAVVMAGLRTRRRAGDHRCGVAMPPCGRQQDTTLQHALSPSRSRTGEMLGPRVSRPANGPLRPGTKLLWARPDR